MSVKTRSDLYILLCPFIRGLVRYNSKLAERLALLGALAFLYLVSVSGRQLEWRADYPQTHINNAKYSRVYKAFRPSHDTDSQVLQKNGIASKFTSIIKTCPRCCCMALHTLIYRF